MSAQTGKHKARSPLAVHRFARGFTQGDLAKRAGVTRATVNYLENGRRPRLKTAQAIARALEVGVDELFPADAEAAE
jgi:putative transcriptional regulator